MAVNGKHFTYNGRSSKEFKLVIGTFDKFDDSIPMGLSRTVDRGEINRYRYRANHFGTTYDDVLEFEISFVKDPCIQGINDLKFSRSEIRDITAWLTSPKYPRLFHMTDLDMPEVYDEYIDYYCIFTDITSYSKSEILSLTFKVTCDSPFGYSQEIKHTFSSTNAQFTTFEIDNTSDDLEDYIYPLLKITPKSTGKLTIQNVTDNGSISIDVLANDILYIDCQKLQIYDETKKLITFHQLGITDIGDIYWFRLCSGVNQIKINGNAEIEVSYREPRKVGAY